MTNLLNDIFPTFQETIVFPPIINQIITETYWYALECSMDFANGRTVTINELKEVATGLKDVSKLTFRYCDSIQPKMPDIFLGGTELVSRYQGLSGLAQVTGSLDGTVVRMLEIMQNSGLTNSEFLDAQNMISEDQRQLAFFRRELFRGIRYLENVRRQHNQVFIPYPTQAFEMDS